MYVYKEAIYFHSNMYYNSCTNKYIYKIHIYIWQELLGRERLVETITIYVIVNGHLSKGFLTRKACYPGHDGF